MQQALYNHIHSASTAQACQGRTARSWKVRLLRHLALKWDLYGVLTLLLSSAAYGVYAIAHVL